MQRLKSVIIVFLIVSLLCTVLSQCSSRSNDPTSTTVPSQPTETTGPAVTTEPPATTLPPITTVPETTVPPVTAPPPETNISGVLAKSAFAYSYSLGAYTYLKGDLEADLYPASITKLFTAYVVLQYLEPDQIVKVGSIVSTVPSDATVAGLYQGDKCTVTELLYGLLLCSGADAARVLAAEAGKAIAGDKTLSDATAITHFVAEMNRQADLLGFVNSHFENADGYHHQDHHTCLADITQIARLVLEDSLLEKIISSSRHTTTISGRKLEWYNTNYLVNTKSHYYISTAIGMKTGNTKAAGRCLLSAFKNGDDITIIGVFGCTDREDHFKSTHAVYQHFFS